MESKDDIARPSSPKKIKLEPEGSAMLRSGFTYSTTLFPARVCTSEQLAPSAGPSLEVKREATEDAASMEVTVREETLIPEEAKIDDNLSSCVLKFEVSDTICDIAAPNIYQVSPLAPVSSFSSNCVETDEKQVDASESVTSGHFSVEKAVEHEVEKVVEHEIEVINEITERQYEVVDLTDDISPASTLPPSPDVENIDAETGSITPLAAKLSITLLNFLDQNVIFDREFISEMEAKINSLDLTSNREETSESKSMDLICPIVVEDDDDIDDDDIMILDICTKSQDNPEIQHASILSKTPEKKRTSVSGTDFSILPMDISPERPENPFQLDLELLKNVLNNKSPTVNPSQTEQNFSIPDYRQNVPNFLPNTGNISSNPAMEQQNNPTTVNPSQIQQNLSVPNYRQNVTNFLPNTGNTSSDPAMEQQNSPFLLTSSTLSKRPHSPEEGFQEEESPGNSSKKLLNIQEYRSRIDPRRKAFPPINTPSPPIINQKAFNVPTSNLDANDIVFPSSTSLPSLQNLSHEERTALFLNQSSQTWNPNISFAQPSALNNFHNQNSPSSLNVSPFAFQSSSRLCTPIVQVPPVHAPQPFNFANAPSLHFNRDCLAGNGQASQQSHLRNDATNGQMLTPSSNELIAVQTADSFNRNSIIAKPLQRSVVRPFVRMPASNPIPTRQKSESTVPQWFKSSVGQSEIQSEHLHLIVLDWDVMSNNFKFQSKELPNHLATEFNQVRNSYSDLLDYYNTYFPLMLVEFWNKLFYSYGLKKREYFFRMTTFETKMTPVQGEEIETYLVQFEAVVKTADVSNNYLPKEKQVVVVASIYGQFLAYVRSSVRRDFSPLHDRKHSTMARNAIALDDPGTKLSKLKLQLEFAFKPLPFKADDVFKCGKLINFKPWLKQNDALLKLKTSHFRDVLFDPLAERCAEIISLPHPANVDKMTNAMDTLYHRVRDCDHQITLVTCVPDQQRDALPKIVNRLRRELNRRLLVCCSEDSLEPLFESLRGLGLVLMVLDRELRRNCSNLLREKSFDLLVKRNKWNKLDALETCEVLLASAANCFYEDIREASFDTCILCDADRFTEPESVICLTYDVRHLVMVGTPGKPCPTTPMTAKWDFGKSLFQRAYDTS